MTYCGCSEPQLERLRLGEFRVGQHAALVQRGELFEPVREAQRAGRWLRRGARRWAGRPAAVAARKAPGQVSRERVRRRPVAHARRVHQRRRRVGNFAHRRVVRGVERRTEARIEVRKVARHGHEVRVRSEERVVPLPQLRHDLEHDGVASQLPEAPRPAIRVAVDIYDRLRREPRLREDRRTLVVFLDELRDSAPQLHHVRDARVEHCQILGAPAQREARVLIQFRRVAHDRARRRPAPDGVRCLGGPRVFRGRTPPERVRVAPARDIVVVWREDVGPRVVSTRAEFGGPRRVARCRRVDQHGHAARGERGGVGAGQRRCPGHVLGLDDDRTARRRRPSPVRQEEGHALGAPRVDGSDPMEAAEFCPLRRVCLEAADRRRSAGRSGDVKAHRAAILPGASGAEKVVRGAAGQQRRWWRRGDRGEQEEAIPSPCHRIPTTAVGEAARASIISL